MAGEKGLKLGKMENAPDWYGTPFDQLDFEWSTEEKLELERYCEKILKNAAEEEMTPLERFEATMQGKGKDRLHIETKYNAPYAARTLDSFADTVKPGDLYQRPKLHVKAHLATAARFKLDIINVYTISYTENFWGADAKMIDYGTPMIIGDFPIKTIEDIEGVEVPDPKKHGLFPGYLWAVKELQRIMAQHGVDKVLPIEVSFCGGTLGNVFLGMTGFTHGMLSIRKNPEFFTLCMDKMNEWVIKFGQAVAELNPNGIYLCSLMGSVPPKGNEWLLDYWTAIAKSITSKKPHPYLWHTLGVPGWLDWMPMYYEKGAVGPGSFIGWWTGPYMPYEKMYEYAREHDLICNASISDTLVLEGNMSAIAEEIKPRAECAKLHPKHSLGFGVIDYWTPPEIVDATFALYKEFGKF